MTKYELRWGGGAIGPHCRLFDGAQHNDALTCFADRVVEFDRDPAFSAAYVQLKRDDGGFSIGWTKTSDERPTFQGEPA